MEVLRLVQHKLSCTSVRRSSCLPDSSAEIILLFLNRGKYSGFPSPTRFEKIGLDFFSTDGKISFFFFLPALGSVIVPFFLFFPRPCT